MNKRDRRQEIAYRPGVLRVVNSAGPRCGSRCVMALGRRKERQREAFRGAPPEQIPESFRMMLIAPLVTDDGVVTFLYALLVYREIFIPEREAGVDHAGAPDHLIFQLDRKSVSHVDHHPVDAERVLIMRNDFRNFLP